MRFLLIHLSELAIGSTWKSEFALRVWRSGSAKRTPKNLSRKMSAKLAHRIIFFMELLRPFFLSLWPFFNCRTCCDLYNFHVFRRREHLPLRPLLNFHLYNKLIYEKKRSYAKMFVALTLCFFASRSRSRASILHFSHKLAWYLFLDVQRPQLTKMALWWLNYMFS